MIDLHSDIREIERYAKKYDHYIPFTNARTQHRMQYDYIAHPLVDGPEEALATKWYDTPDQVMPLDICREKAIGALVGLAVGDAVGTTLEFMPRDRRTVADMVGGGPFRLKPGEWTDDTSMALCLAETLLEMKYADSEIFRNKLLRWYREGYNSVNGICFDIGNTTRYALEQYALHGPEWCGNSEPEVAGNASIIRLAPVAIYFRRNFAKAFYNAKKQSKATHGAMEAAMWAVWNTDNFRDAILLAANLADDADSVAATAGQLAGALYGWSGIPQEWRDKLAEHDRIASLAGALFAQAPDNYPG